MRTETLSLDHGAVIGIGGTNFRSAEYVEGELKGFQIQGTPTEPESFFTAMGRALLVAADNGASYGVVGVPGTVFEEFDEDGSTRQRLDKMANIQGLSAGSYYPVESMTNADPAVGRLLDQGFPLWFTNDGNLAVHAAIAKLAKGSEEVIADIIVGTGLGGALARRDLRFPQRIFHVESGSWELGHNIRKYKKPTDTEENDIAGPAIERKYGIKAEDLPKHHPALRHIAGRLAVISANLGMNGDVELVVFSGGVAIGRQDDLESPIKALLDKFRASDNPGAKLIPDEIMFVPKEMEKEFELYGAQGVMRSYLIQKVLSSMIIEATQPDNDRTTILHAAKFRGDLRRLVA